MNTEGKTAEKDITSTMATTPNHTNMEKTEKICCSQCRSGCNSLLCSRCEAKTINITPVLQDSEVIVVKEEQPAKKRRRPAMNYLIIQCLEE